MTVFSVLDLSPIPEGGTAAEALANTLDLARHAEAWGYRRFWLAEHHNMPGIASAATAVVIGQVAAATSTHPGRGGRDHAAEPRAARRGRGLRDARHLLPGRIDLGLGRAPGTDMATARALRRHLDGGDSFPQDVMELIGYFADDPAARIRAIPGTGTRVPVWILGSSLYGAQLAAHLGLPYAFASHFAPGELEPAIEVYRTSFRASEHLAEPYLMLAFNVFAAGSDAEGRRLKTSMQQAFANLRMGRPGPLPRPVDDITRHLDPMALAMADRALSCSAAGAPETVRRALDAFIARHAPDELILTGQIHDHAARLRSFEIAAEILAQEPTRPAGAALG